MQQTLTALLDRASDLELRVADIYEHLADQFEADATVSHFWALFAEAERYHSLIIQMQKLAMTEATSDAAQVSAWEGEIAETSQYLAEILGRMNEQGWRPSLAEAFDLAQEIESRSLEVQSRSFALFESPVIKDLVARLHKEDMEHRNKLMTAKSRFAAADA